MSLIAALDASPGSMLRAVPVLEFADPANGLATSIEELNRVAAAYASDFVDAFPGMDQVELAEHLVKIEDLSRTVEYLQVAAAAAVDRSSADAGGRPTEGDSPAATGGAAATGGVGFAFGLPASAAGARSVYRCTAEYLRDRLRISRTEANRRLRLGGKLLPRTTLTGDPLPAACEHLAAEVSAGVVSGKAATMIANALDRARYLAEPAVLDTMEAQLTASATRFDPDFLTKLIHRFEAHLDPDGPEPTDKELTARQGVFLRGKKRGLHQLDIAATDEQYEHLITIMNTATNPRTSWASATTSSGQADDGDGGGDGPGHGSGGEHGNGGEGGEGGRGGEGGSLRDCPGTVDTRTRAQLLLDGLVGACQVALATDKLPATGGQRPQVLVTIDYKTLLDDLQTHTGATPATPSTSDGVFTTTGATFTTSATPTDGACASNSTLSNGDATLTEGGFSPAVGASLAYTGPVSARTARKIACDADLIPVVLGGNNEILDLGRTQRLFTAKQRKALIARDQGCAFPACTMPAHWTEAHHITPWSHGGPTSTDNGVLLCSHHHHLIHQNDWTIQIRDRIPWFIPPAYLDPDRQPRRNHYWTLC